jgi:ketosteroid isomerase-like protein
MHIGPRPIDAAAPRIVDQRPVAVADSAVADCTAKAAEPPAARQAPAATFEGKPSGSAPVVVTDPAKATADANAAAVTRFYEAFNRHDGAAMAALYHPDAVFEDPAFGVLRGSQIGAMWKKLAAAAPDLAVKSSNVVGTPTGARAHWDADYTFLTGQKVHNSVEGSFVFKDGLIMKHTDSFSFPAWAGQALGLSKLGGFGDWLAKSSVTQGVMQWAARSSL